MCLLGQIASTIRLQAVKIAHDSGKAPNRDPAAALVQASGSAALNVATLESLDGIARRATLDPTHYAVSYFADEEAGVIAVYPVPVATPDSVAPRRRQKTRTASIQLNEVFAQYPKLKPTVRRKRCLTTVVTDADGKECLMLAMKAGQPKRKAPGTAKVAQKQAAAAIDSGT